MQDARVGNRIVTAGGRVLGVTAVALTREAAIEQAYRDVARIHFPKRALPPGISAACDAHRDVGGHV
jgi:phosphoribosylamine-glycine ligase